MITKYGSFEHFEATALNTFCEHFSDNGSREDAMWVGVINHIENFMMVLFVKYEQIKDIKRHLRNYNEHVQFAIAERMERMSASDAIRFQEEEAPKNKVPVEEYTKDLNELYFISILSAFEAFWDTMENLFPILLNKKKAKKNKGLAERINAFIEDAAIVEDRSHPLERDKIFNLYRIRNILVHSAGRLSIWASGNARGFSPTEAYCYRECPQKTTTLIKAIDSFSLEKTPPGERINKIFKCCEASDTDACDANIQDFINIIDEEVDHLPEIYRQCVTNKQADKHTRRFLHKFLACWEFEAKGLTLANDTLVIDTDFNFYALDTIGSFIWSLSEKLIPQKNS